MSLKRVNVRATIMTAILTVLQNYVLVVTVTTTKTKVYFFIYFSKKVNR